MVMEKRGKLMHKIHLYDRENNNYIGFNKG